jgi:tape measure domain-containing protein
MARRDVDLVIRARDEAKGALDSINQTLQKFVDQQRETQAEAGRTDSQMDRLGAAIKKLQTDLGGLTGAGAVERELERARAAMNRLEQSTERAAGEAIGYRREARQSARATAELRGEADRLAGAISQQKAVLARARQAQKALSTETEKNAKVQALYAARQRELGQSIAKQNLNLANYKARFRELQTAITQVAKPTAALRREFDRTASNIQRTEAKIADLSETQRLIGAETDRANRAITRARDLYGRQAASVDGAAAALARLKAEQDRTTSSLRQAEIAQGRLETSADKAAGALRAQEQTLERAQENYRGVEQASRETEGALAELEARVRGPLLRAFGEQRARLKATEQAYETSSAAAQEYARELRTAVNPSKELEAAFESQRAAAALARQEVRAQQRALAELRAILRESGGDVTDFASRQQRSNAVIERARRGFDTYGNAADAAATAGERLVRSQSRAQQQTGRLASATNNLSRATRNAAQKQTLFAQALRQYYGETRTALSWTQRLRGEVLSLIAAYGGFFALIDLVRNTVNAFQALEAATNRLNVVFNGDRTLVNQELDFIRRNAERLGIEFGVLAQEYTKFAVATQGTNLEGAETRRIFISVAEAARVNNLNLDQLRGTFVALTQMVSKGSVSMEELRQQLGDRLPGALQIMAAGLGVTTEELIKMVERGQVSSDALSGFADELDRRFSDALPTALENTNAALGRFQNALFQTFLRIGEGGAIRGFVNLLENLTDTLDSAKFRDFANNVGKALQGLFEILGALAQNFDLVIAAMAAFISFRLSGFVVAVIAVLSRMPAILRFTRMRFNALRGTVVATTASLTGATAAVVRLRAALTILMSSTGIGLLVTLIGTGIGLWITRTEDATEVLRTHEKILDRVKNAYEEAGGSIERWRVELENITKSEARENLLNIEREIERVNDLFDGGIGGIGGLFQRNVFGALSLGENPVVRQFIQESAVLYESFRQQNIGAKELRIGLDDLIEKYREGQPRVVELGEAILDAAVELENLSDKQEYARDVMIALTGTEEEASAAMARLAERFKVMGVAVDDAQENIDKYREAITKLRDLVPSLADEIEDMEDRAQLVAARDAAVQYARTWGQVLQAFELYNQALKDSDLSSFTQQFQGVGGGPAGLAGELIRGFEGFRQTPYFDVNALRIGYGSDTVTLSDGTIRAVTEGMKITRADADRDLVRRIMTEFMPAAREAIGASRFDAMDPRQQAVLTSLAYNYGAGEFASGGDLAAIADAVREGSTEGVAEAIRNLGSAQFDPNSQTGAGLIDRRNREAALFEAGGSLDLSGFVTAQEGAARLAAQQAEEQRRAREATLATLDDQQFQIAQQELINAGQEREAAIQEAIRAARAENVDLTREQAEQVALNARRLFDLQNAERLANAERERAAELEERVNQLLQLREQLLQQLEASQIAGVGADALAEIQAELGTVNRLIEEAIQNALDFAVAMGSSDPVIQALIARLRELQLQGVQSAGEIRLSYEQVEQALSGSLFNGAMRFAEALAEGKSVAESLREAFLQFAADFLRQIAQMILQQLALNSAQMILGAFGFGAGGAIVLHSGGIVGQRGAARQVDAGVFMNAVRYHGGGIAGLMPNEVPAVLRRGEEVLTQDDPRHMFNSGGQGQSAPGARVKIVNALDGGQVISEGLNTSAGEEAILNFIRSNAPSVRAAIET